MAEEAALGLGRAAWADPRWLAPDDERAPVGAALDVSLGWSPPPPVARRSTWPLDGGGGGGAAAPDAPPAASVRWLEAAAAVLCGGGGSPFVHDPRLCVGVPGEAGATTAWLPGLPRRAEANDLSARWVVRRGGRGGDGGGGDGGGGGGGRRGGGTADTASHLAVAACPKGLNASAVDAAPAALGPSAVELPPSGHVDRTSAAAAAATVHRDVMSGATLGACVLPSPSPRSTAAAAGAPPAPVYDEAAAFAAAVATPAAAARSMALRHAAEYDRTMFQVDPPPEPVTDSEAVLAVVVVFPEAIGLLLLVLGPPAQRQRRQRRGVDGPRDADGRWDVDGRGDADGPSGGDGQSNACGCGRTCSDGRGRDDGSAGTQAFVLVFFVGAISLAGVWALAVGEVRASRWRAAATHVRLSVVHRPGASSWDGTSLAYTEQLIMLAPVGYRPALVMGLAVALTSAYGVLALVCAARGGWLVLWRRRRPSQADVNDVEGGADGWSDIHAAGDADGRSLRRR